MQRSLLFVPAKEKFLTKISEFNSDCYIIDLEDSIAERDKDDALKLLCNYLSTSNQSGIYVRLNKDSFSVEANALNIYNIGFMLPKFEDVEEYIGLESIWKQHEIIALIETPKGLVNISKIVPCSWIDALAFGAEDFTASMNMQSRDELLLPFKSSLVTYAKAYSKKVFDTPSFSISDQEKFEREVITSVNLGFDGKLLINPKHIDYINSSFGANDLEHLKFIVSEYDRRGEAVIVLDGNVYEKMHINRFRKILKENKYV